MPALSLFLAFTAALAAQTGSLQDRIRRSGLPLEQRDRLTRLLASKDYAAMEAMLAGQAAGSELPTVAGERLALAGAVEFLEGRMERAVSAFRQSDALAPLDDAGRFTLAMAFARLGDAKEARDQLERLSAAHPDAPLYLYWLARIDYDQRLYGQAIERLKRVIRLEPNAARAYDNLGLALDMLGQTDEAREAFQKAVALNRDATAPSAWPPHNLGVLLLRTQQLQESESALRESLRYDPGFAMAHYHLGRTLEAEGREDEAIEEYRKATSGNERLPEALYSLGLVYRRHNRDREAQAAFAEYRKLRSQSAP